MKIELPKVIASVQTQPVTATILANNAGRADAIITLVSGGPFYIKRGTSPSSTSWDYQLIAAGQTLTIENYHGILTCSPTPTAGQLNVAEGQDRTP